MFPQIAPLVDTNLKLQHAEWFRRDGTTRLIAQTTEAQGFLYAGDELAAMDLARNYHRWIFDLFQPFLGPRVVEVGAGIGSFSRQILRSKRVTQFTALEPAENLFPMLCQRLSGDPRAQALRTYLNDLELSSPADSVTAVNVMEHIQDDVAFVRQAHRVLAPSGTLLLLVPALPWIYGQKDQAFGHFRRYRRAQVRELLQNAGFHIELLRYVNLPGILSWFFTGRVLKRSTIPASDVRFYDGAVIPLVRRIETLCPPPIGQNLVAVARKP